MGFNLIYWKHICGLYFLDSSPLEKCGILLKNGRFFGRIWPDWGNTALADMAGLGSIGLTYSQTCLYYLPCSSSFSQFRSHRKKVPRNGTV